MADDFQASETFQGERPGFAFKMGPRGLGYYLDAVQGNRSFWDEVVTKLPESWRDAPFREAILKVHPDKGCGLGMAHSEFGLLVETVEEVPGQDLQSGEVIVAIEGRILASLSAPQVQASFQKRRLDGARLFVANLAQVKDLSKRDPNIIEMWDPLKKANYFFHKKTGRSAWTMEELLPPEASEKSEPSQSGKPEEQKSGQAPIDLSHFLQHGFAKQKEPPKKKAKVKAAPKEGESKDESDRAREERSRWRDWNEGGRGGYTEQFFERYKGVRMEEPNKNKFDKRMKGSVGPGTGMEYMARWTGSKNSFN